VLCTIVTALYNLPEGKSPLQRRRWEGNIKMGLRELAWDGVDWIDLAQDRDQWRTLVNIVKEPSGSIRCWEILE
jgi:hypothetical protein